MNHRNCNWTQVIVFMGISFMVSTGAFTLLVSSLGAMPEWSVLDAPASRKVQSILENRAFRAQVDRLGMVFFDVIVTYRDIS